MNGLRLGCKSNKSTGFAKFFGGIRCGGKFHLTRLAEFPLENKTKFSPHETESCVLPTIDKEGVTYRCVGVSGTQPGVAAEGGKSYMWFQTNWRPVDDAEAQPIAGLARVLIHDTDNYPNSYINETVDGSGNYSYDWGNGDVEPYDFTLIDSWLVDGEDGNPEHWDSRNKLCHHLSYGEPASSASWAETPSAKTCVGPSHFAFLRKRHNYPLCTQHKLVFWTPGSATPQVHVWNNHERLDGDHSWIVGDFDANSFPIGLFFHRASESSAFINHPGAPVGGEEVTFSGDERGQIWIQALAASAKFPSLAPAFVVTDNNSSKFSLGLQSSGVGNPGSPFPAHQGNFNLISHSHAVDVGEETENDPYVFTPVGVFQQDARTYSVDFSISRMASTTLPVEVAEGGITGVPTVWNELPLPAPGQEISPKRFFWAGAPIIHMRGSLAHGYGTAQTSTFFDSPHPNHYLTFGRYARGDYNPESTDAYQDSSLYAFSPGGSDYSPMKYYGSLFPSCVAGFTPDSGTGFSFPSSSPVHYAHNAGPFILLRRGHDDIPVGPARIINFSYRSLKHFKGEEKDPNQPFGDNYELRGASSKAKWNLSKDSFPPVGELVCTSPFWVEQSDFYMQNGCPDWRFTFQGIALDINQSNDGHNEIYPFAGEVDQNNIEPLEHVDIHTRNFFDQYQVVGTPGYGNPEPHTPYNDSVATVGNRIDGHAPRGVWWDESNVKHFNGVLSCGGPLVSSLVR